MKHMQRCCPALITPHLEAQAREIYKTEMDERVKAMQTQQLNTITFDNIMNDPKMDPDVLNTTPISLHCYLLKHTGRSILHGDSVLSLQPICADTRELCISSSRLSEAMGLRRSVGQVLTIQHSHSMM